MLEKKLDVKFLIYFCVAVITFALYLFLVIIKFKMIDFSSIVVMPISGISMCYGVLVVLGFALIPMFVTSIVSIFLEKEDSLD